MPPNDGMRIVIGMLDAAARAFAHTSRRGLIDLLERRIAERVELHLDDGLPSRERQADRGARDAGLAIGVSNTRSAPNSACSPSVTRNTPPSAPTSSPNTSTRGSSASASRSARVQRAGHRDLRHRRAPPPRWRTNGAGGSAYVQSNIHSAGGASVRDHARADLRDPRSASRFARRDERLVGVPGGEQPRPVARDRIDCARQRSTSASSR